MTCGGGPRRQFTRMTDHFADGLRDGTPTLSVMQAKAVVA